MHVNLSFENESESLIFVPVLGLAVSKSGLNLTIKAQVSRESLQTDQRLELSLPL